MKASVKIRADELIEKLKGRLDGYEGKGSAAMAKACLAVEGEAKRRAPVDDGLLRRSITHRVIEQDGAIVGQVGTNVHYAIHVEYGHRTRLGTGEKSSRIQVSTFSEPLKKKRKKGDKYYRPRRTATGTRGAIHYVPGRYFLTNAIRAKRDSVINILVRELGKE